MFLVPSFWDAVSLVYLLSNKELPDLGFACWVHSCVNGERIASLHYLGSVFLDGGLVRVRGRVFNERIRQFAQVGGLMGFEDFFSKVTSTPVVRLMENVGVLEDFVVSGLAEFDGNLDIGVKVGGVRVNYGELPVSLKIDGVIYGSGVVLSMDFDVREVFGVSKWRICARCVGGLGKTRFWFDRKLRGELGKLRKVMALLEASKRGSLPAQAVIEELFLEPVRDMGGC